MSLPRSLRLLPVPAALIVAAVCAYLPLGLYDLWHPEVFDPGNSDMTGAVAVLVGLALTAGALLVAPAFLLVFTLGTARVRAGSRRWHGTLLFFCVPGVLLDVALVRAALSSATTGSGAAPAPASLAQRSVRILVAALCGRLDGLRRRAVAAADVPVPASVGASARVSQDMTGRFCGAGQSPSRRYGPSRTEGRSELQFVRDGDGYGGALRG